MDAGLSWSGRASDVQSAGNPQEVLGDPADCRARARSRRSYGRVSQRSLPIEVTDDRVVVGLSRFLPLQLEATLAALGKAPWCVSPRLKEGAIEMQVWRLEAVRLARMENKVSAQARAIRERMERGIAAFIAIAAPRRYQFARRRSPEGRGDPYNESRTPPALGRAFVIRLGGRCATSGGGTPSGAGMLALLCASRG